MKEFSHFLQRQDIQFPILKRIALLHDKADVVNAIEEAEKLRKDYDVVIYEKPKKLSKFLDKIQAKGYFGFCFLGEEIRELKK